MESTVNEAGNEGGSITVGLPEPGADADLAEVLAQFTNLIMNERIRAFNEGVDVERERCAKVAEGLSTKPGWSPGYQGAAATIAKAIREQ